jgi:hypothetical protein
VFLHGAGDSGALDIQLTLKSFSDDYDYAVLTSAVERPHLDLYTGEIQPLVGTQVALCSYHMTLHEELPEFEQGIAVTPVSLAFLVKGISSKTASTDGQGHIWKASKGGHFFLYSSACWPGDSGPAVVLYDGSVVGMHSESINRMRERIDRDKTTGDRLTLLEESVDSAVESLSQGAIALAARTLLGI